LANLREKILGASDIRREQVHVPEWDVEVEVRGLTGAQRARLMKTSLDSKGAVDFEKMFPELLITSTFEPGTGQPVFTEADRDALGGKSGAALDRIAQAAMRLSGLTPGAVEEAEKNSDATPSDASTSS